jgi:hypothetical protein
LGSRFLSSSQRTHGKLLRSCFAGGFFFVGSCFMLHTVTSAGWPCPPCASAVDGRRLSTQCRAKKRPALSTQPRDTSHTVTHTQLSLPSYPMPSPSLIHTHLVCELDNSSTWTWWAQDYCPHCSGLRLMQEWYVVCAPFSGGAAVTPAPVHALRWYAVQTCAPPFSSPWWLPPPPRTCALTLGSSSPAFAQ